MEGNTIGSVTMQMNELAIWLKHPQSKLGY
jgi:hypothetical protein